MNELLQELRKPPLFRSLFLPAPKEEVALATFRERTLISAGEYLVVGVPVAVSVYSVFHALHNTYGEMTGIGLMTGSSLLASIAFARRYQPQSKARTRNHS